MLFEVYSVRAKKRMTNQSISTWQAINVEVARSISDEVDELPQEIYGLKSTSFFWHKSALVPDAE